MVQFNLLPDVKQQYIKAVYRKRMITILCIVVAAVCLFIFVLMFLIVRVNQARHLSNLDKDITTGVNELRSNPDLDKVLTVQNQLASLPSLHDQKIMTSRVFSYLSQVTPAKATVTELELDTTTNTITIKGTADELLTVNKFVDTLKFTDFRLAGDPVVEGKAFSSVVLTNFNLAAADDTNAGSVTYEISLKYDPNIFKNTAVDGSATANSVKLTVPKIITTRSETQKPSELFEQSTTQNSETQQ